MGKINFGNGGFQLVDAGVHDFMVTDVEVAPRDGEPKSVNVKCVTREGVKWNNKYNLPRGQKALFVLVTRGLGFEPSDLDGGFDPKDMVGHAFTAEIVHRESDRGNTFANLGTIEGPCAPWGDDDEYDEDELL